MISLTRILSLLALAGYVFGQGSQMFHGRSMSMGRHNGRGSVDMFNRNLQLDSIGFHRGGSSRPMGRGIQEDPDFIRRIIGSTVAGRELRMGEIGLPRHGGAGRGEQYANGMLNGWNGDPQTLTTQFQDSWSDPFMGGPVPQLPAGFSGDFGSLGGGFRMPRFGGQFWYNNALLQRLEATEDLVKVLSNRVDLLESREKIYLNRIVDLESRDRKQQQLIDELTKTLEDHLQTYEQLIKKVHKTVHNISNDESMVIALKSRVNSGHRRHTKSERAVQRIRQMDMESPVAFFALIGGAHFEHAGVNQVFVFDHVITNLSNGYSNRTGHFTAPVEGVYVFSTTLMSRYHIDAHASFYRNSDKINTMFASGKEAGYDTTGSTIILELKQGDVVSIHNGDLDVAYTGLDYSSFSGFLLSTFVYVPNIVG